MGKFDQQLTHWRELHRIALEDLEELHSGKRKIAEDTGEGWVDVTDHWIEKLRTEVVVFAPASRIVREVRRKRFEPQPTRAGGLGSQGLL
jgi:hypothetical protein